MVELPNIKPKVLAVIPAKGRSIRVPGKNMKDFLGQPLMYWTIRQAQDTALLTDICVSSDCPEILNYARSLGISMNIKRPKAMAEDNATTDSVIFHALQECRWLSDKQYDLVVTLQVTSPLRPKGLIHDCVKYLWTQQHYNTVLTVHSPGNFIWMGGTENPLDFEQINIQHRPLSQDFRLGDQAFVENGSVYVTRADALSLQMTRVAKPVYCYEIGSIYGLDIDTETDFSLAELAVKYLDVNAKEVF